MTDTDIYANIVKICVFVHALYAPQLPDVCGKNSAYCVRIFTVVPTDVTRETQIKSDDHYLSLKACHKVDKKWMPNSICYFKNVSFRHKAVHFISSDHITFLQSFYGKVIASVFVLS